jgi:hypothetical protein
MMSDKNYYLILQTGWWLILNVLYCIDTSKQAIPVEISDWDVDGMHMYYLRLDRDEDYNKKLFHCMLTYMVYVISILYYFYDNVEIGLG